MVKESVKIGVKVFSQFFSVNSTDKILDEVFFYELIFFEQCGKILIILEFICRIDIKNFVKSDFIHLLLTPGRSTSAAKSIYFTLYR